MDKISRLDRRIPINFLIEYEGFERDHRDRALNLSRGGVFILTPNPFPPGRRLQLRFELPDLNLEIHAAATVRWVAANGSNHSKGMGLKFDEDDAPLRQLLELYVDVEHEVSSAFSVLERPKDPPKPGLFVFPPEDN
ncbi:MAG: TIGR02266 family protein [Pseudomonadota bacterium]